jgi:hypothetical protein
MKKSFFFIAILSVLALAVSFHFSWSSPRTKNTIEDDDYYFLVVYRNDTPHVLIQPLLSFNGIPVKTFVGWGDGDKEKKVLPEFSFYVSESIKDPPYLLFWPGTEIKFKVPKRSVAAALREKNSETQVSGFFLESNIDGMVFRTPVLKTKPE